MTAICTPTRTRAEFESILRELEKIGVLWINDVPAGEYRGFMDYTQGADKFLIYENENICRHYSPNNSKVLPRADFIAAIRRDFAPKEKPEMNYNRMLKKDLIAELKKRDAAIKNINTHREHIAKELTNQAEKTRSALQSLEMANVWVDKYDALEKTNEEFRAKWTEQDRQLNRSDRVKNATIELLEKAEGKILKLEKTNAEQAEKIEDLNSRLLSSEERNINTHTKMTQEASKAYHAQHENTRMKRLAAQMLCPDVLEGK